MTNTLIVNIYLTSNGINAGLIPSVYNKSLLISIRNIPVLSLLSLSKASSIEEDIDLEKNRVHSSRVEGQKLLALINYILLY